MRHADRHQQRGWFGREWVKTRARFGKLAYLVLGLGIGACLFSWGAAIANTLVDQGMAGKYGPWPVTITAGTAAIGEVIAVGKAANGAAVSGNPVLVAGYDGTNVRTVRVNGYGGVNTYESILSPGVPTNVSLSANVSGTICSLTASVMYLISCNADAAFRTGAATPTAVATDTDLPARTSWRVRLQATETCFAFISGSAAVCKASIIGIGP